MHTNTSGWRVMNRSAMAAAVAMSAVLASIGLTGNANAVPAFLDAWKQQYPNSTLPQRMQQQLGSECFICHNPASFGDPGTCYRSDVRNLIWDGHSILDALVLADGMDSDGDGFTNGEQINMPRPDLPGEVGYHPGLSGCFGNDECSAVPATAWTGIAESPTIEPLVGDLNCDGAVTVSDLLVLLGKWGACPGDGACIADLNGDGVVDVSDLLVLLANWG